MVAKARKGQLRNLLLVKFPPPGFETFIKRIAFEMTVAAARVR